ncbi:hypothetical protein RHMOL_Rhmol10G0131600 [Rhododendron molle]|uniref:Uncharacterized protein n=1 Tax=Rhododendron molle TaxID=49168 RepID=A0ACC0M213_RHOML|nr:hypothetical protein RHMOL_Rhmol10G0131600 [Rhododendron molle]
MFLMLNFHNFVTIKLDSTNYMLWRIQVENIVSANGFYEYLDGSVECPERHIGNDEGNLIPNTAYTMWKLINTQSLSCKAATYRTLMLEIGRHPWFYESVILC